MGFFPKLYYTIYTKKTPAEVYAILKGETAVWGMAHYPLGEGAFVGEVGASEFKIEPKTSWFRHHFSMAVIEGSIEEEAGETVVSMKVRVPYQMHLLFPMTLCMMAWFLISSSAPLIVAVIAGVMLCLFWLITWIQTRGWFYFDAKGAKRKLEVLFGETVCTD